MLEVANGASYLVKGMGYLFKWRVMPFVAIPLVINIALYYFGVNALYDAFALWLASWLDNLPDWLDFLGAILRFLFAALLAVLVALTFSSVANLLGAPFYGLLSEQVVVLATGETPEQPLNVATLIKIIPRTLGRELRKLLYYLPRALLLGLLSLLAMFLIPPLQPVMTILWFLFGARMMSIQYTDYAFDNDLYSFGQMRQSLKGRRPLTLGFGGATQVALMVPLLPILFVPAAVCGATLLYCDRLKAELPPAG